MKIKEAIITFQYTSEEGYVFWVECKERLAPRTAGGQLEQVSKLGYDDLWSALRDLKRFMKQGYVR